MIRARETGLKDQVAALDAQAAGRDAYLKLADDLEGFLARLRQGMRMSWTTARRTRCFSSVVAVAGAVRDEVMVGADAGGQT